MRRYELMLLLRPDLEDDRLQAAVEKVTRAIVNAGGSLSKVSPWGKRRLAYEIQHHREASYFLIHFDIEPSQVRDIERGMLITEDILRHLVTVLEDRGPVDEIAPAAAPRASDVDDDGEISGAEPAESNEKEIAAEAGAGDASAAPDVAEADQVADAAEADEVVDVPEAADVAAVADVAEADVEEPVEERTAG